MHKKSLQFLEHVKETGSKEQAKLQKFIDSGAMLTTT